MLIKLADLYNVTIDYIVGRVENRDVLVHSLIHNGEKYLGVYTFYQYDFKKGQNITVEYSSNLERGKINDMSFNNH